MDYSYALAFLAGLCIAGLIASLVGRVRSSVPAKPEREPAPQPDAHGAREPQLLGLAGASHELRTPLNGILGMAHLLSETELSPEQMTYVDAIRSEGNALLSIVDDVLDGARMQAGHFEPVCESFDVVSLVEGVAELLGPRAHEKGLAIAASIPPNLPRMVQGDAGRLRQALMNLAGNAVKFTRSGSIGLFLSRNGNGQLELAVEDTGPGIPEEQRDRIFEAFEKGEAASPHESTGLGLSITRNIITQYKGRIDLTSRVGEGARFTVALDWRSEAPALTAANITDLTGRSVLIVAKDDHQRRFLRDHLIAAGADAFCRESIAAGLDAIQKKVPTILLVDGSFGKLAGELASVAAQAGVRRSLVLLSAQERRSFGPPKEQGFDAFLMKPVRTSSLFDRIEADPVERPLSGIPAAMPGATLAGRRILLVEDDPVSAHLLRRLLEKRGAIVTHAPDAATASLSLAQSPGQPFDTAILDKILPGNMSGLDLARSIRSGEERKQPMLILLSSADIGARETELALAAGCDRILPKPVDPRTLDALLQRSGAHGTAFHSRAAA